MRPRLRSWPGLLPVLVACVLAGCGQEPEPSATPKPPKKAPAAPPGPPAPVKPPAGGGAEPAADPYAYGWIGGHFSDLSPEQATERGLPSNRGALVVKVPADTPAAAADLKPDDFVYLVNGKEVADSLALVVALRTLVPGASARLLVQRGKERVTLSVAVKSRPVKLAVAALMQSGAAYLAAQQHEEGWWPHASAIFVPNGDISIAYTALSFAALAHVPRELRDQDPEVAAALKKALEYIQKNLDPTDGGFLDPRQAANGDAVLLRNFSSSCVLTGLVTLGREEHADAIKKLSGFLEKRQLSELNDFPPTDWHHGGWNYYEDNRGFSLRTDMISVAYALEGLAAAGLPKDNPNYSRARRFLERSQNYQDNAGARLLYDDGGFAFNPRSSKAGEITAGPNNIRFLSYGTVTADGIRSLIHAGLAPNDPRVEAALDWLRKHYDVERVPGFPPDFPTDYGRGLYFYYLRSLADALAVAGQKVVVSADGKTHYWMREIVDRLHRLQGPDGQWQNPINIMNEDDPIVATSLALLTLSRIDGLLK